MGNPKRHGADSRAPAPATRREAAAGYTDAPMPPLFARAAAALRAMPPWVVLALSALLWAVMLGVLALGRYGGDPRAFVCLGELRLHPAVLDDVPRTSDHGYDGQYYATLATDPLLLEPETEASLDAPRYRAGRIGLPLAAWLLAFGRPAPALIIYQLLCWAGCLAAVYLAARWLAAEGLPAAWALLLTLSAGLATSMLRSTPDGAAVALILAALWWRRQGRPRAEVLALTAATLVRETSLLAAAALAFLELRQRRVRAAAVRIAVPFAVFAGWRLLLRPLIADDSRGRIAGNFGLPFAWLPGKLEQLAEMGLPAARMEVAGFLALIAGWLLLVVVGLRFRRWSAAEAVFAAFGLLGLVLATPVYVEVYAHTRVLLALPFLALLVLRPESGRGVRRLTVALPVLLAVTGLFVIRGELGRATVSSALRALAGHPTGIATGEPASYLLPALRVSGPFGTQWRSQLELANPCAEAAELRLELLRAGRSDGSPPQVRLGLAANGELRVADVLGGLFRSDGVAAVRIVGEGGCTEARIRIHDPSGRTAPGPAVAAFDTPIALGPDRELVLPGLASAPGGRGRTRTSLGILNLSPTPIDLEVTVLDAGGGVLGSKRLRLGRQDLRQLNDLFAASGAPPAAAASATIRSPSFGARVLAYAVVARREPAGLSLVLPEPPPPR